MPGSVAKARSCIAVKALVPWKKQWEEYEAKLAEAMGYNPARDVPRFLSFTAERAEVGDDPNAPLEWATVMPPPAYNFASLPHVDSRDPVWDDPGLPGRLARGP